MFRKLIKYDLMSVWKIWWLMAVSALGISVIGSFCIRIASDIKNIELPPIISSILIMIAVFSVIGVCATYIMTMILVFLRYYKNFFTDEGYLTFTLPISRSKQLASKMLNAIIWMVSEFILLIACVSIYITFSLVPDSGQLIDPFIWNTVFAIIGDFFAGTGLWSILFIIVSLIIVLAYLVAFISLIYMCITIGSIIVKKAKLLLSVGIYYAVNSVFSILYTVIGVVCLPSVFAAISEKTSVMSFNQSNAFSLLIFLFVAVIIATVAAAIYMFTLRQLEKKLNLN